MLHTSDPSESKQQKETDLKLKEDELYRNDTSEIKNKIEIKEYDSDFEKQRKSHLISVHKKYLLQEYLRKQPKEKKIDLRTVKEKRIEKLNKVIVDSSHKLESDNEKTKNWNSKKQKGTNITYETQGGKVVTVFKRQSKKKKK